MKQKQKTLFILSIDWLELMSSCSSNEDFFQYRKLYNADVIAADISISQSSTGINLHYTK